MLRTHTRLSTVGVLGVALTLLSPLLFAPARATAQEAAGLGKVKELNEKGIEAYENLDVEEARKLLLQSLEICAAEGLTTHPLKAVTHLNLGIVLVGGFKQRETGIKQFRRALEIDSTVKIAKRLSSPEIQAAFEAAVNEVAAGGAPVAPTPAAPEPETPAAPPSPEPSFPSDPLGAVPEGLQHEPIKQSRPNTAISIRASASDRLGLDKLVLAYRPEGATSYLTRDMDKEAGGAYVARIPDPMTRGNEVAYYLEAQGRGGEVLASSGSAAEPHVIALGVVSAKAAEPPGGSRAGGGLGGKLWISFGAGGGYGYAKGNPEVTPRKEIGGQQQAISFAGTAPAQLLHLIPEIGYLLNPNLLISVQARLQVITGANEARSTQCPGGICTPAKGATAVLGKATWLTEPIGKIRPFLGVAVGAGEVRYLVSLDRVVSHDCGNGTEVCMDTVRVGPFFAGAGVGAHIPFTDSMFAAVSLNGLVALPNFGANFDLNLGLGVKL